MVNYTKSFIITVATWGSGRGSYRERGLMTSGTFINGGLALGYKIQSWWSRRENLNFKWVSFKNGFV